MRINQEFKLNHTVFEMRSLILIVIVLNDICKNLYFWPDQKVTDSISSQLEAELFKLLV